MRHEPYRPVMVWLELSCVIENKIRCAGIKIVIVLTPRRRCQVQFRF